MYSMLLPMDYTYFGGSFYFFNDSMKKKGNEVFMDSHHINPFLESSVFVIEQVCQVRPSLGKLRMETINYEENIIWLQIGVIGDIEGDLVFGFPRQVALKMVSGMMGGYAVTEFDEMSQSAISELGNMISGNACTMLFNQGVKIDITPPRMNHFIQRSKAVAQKAITISLKMDGIGEMNLYILVLPRVVDSAVHAC